MSNNNESTTKFKVDISELKAGIQEANKNIKLANAEFKAAAAGMDDWSKSADGISAKLTQLNTVLENQKSKLSNYKKQQESLDNAYAENSKRADELKATLQQLSEQGVSKTSAEYKKYEKALTEVEKEMASNQKASDNMKVTVLNQQAAVNKTENEIKKYSAALESLESDSKQTVTATDKLTKTIEAQQSELDELKNKYKSVVLEQGESSEEAKALATQIQKLSGELGDNKAKLNDASEAADKLDKSLDNIDPEGTADGFTVMKGALANLVANGINAAIQGLKKLTSAANEAYQQYDEGADNIITATGATGEAAAGLQKAYKNVTKNVVGDFSEMGSALGEINTRFGFTGKNLEDSTAQFMKFAEITGTDAVSAVQLVSRAMGDAGIESSEYSSVLDSLALAAQASGISIDSLTGNLTKYGAPMRALGFDTQESIAIFSQWEKAGVNTEIAFSGMKKAISNWAKDGKDSRLEFKKTLDEIAACPDIASATTKAIEIFGAKAGPDLADAIQGGRFEYSQFLDLLKNSEGTVTNTYEATQDGADKMKLAFQNMKSEVGDALASTLDKIAPEIEKMMSGIDWEGIGKAVSDGIGLVVNVFKWIIDNKDSIVAALTGAAAAVGAYVAYTTAVKVMKEGWMALEIVQKAVAAAQWLLNAAMSANPIGLVVAAVVGLVAAFMVLWKNSEGFREFWINLWEKVKEITGVVVTAIKDFFTNLWEDIKIVWGVVSQWFSDLWTGIKEAAVAIITPIIEFFTGIWEGIKAVFTPVIEWFTALFTSIWNTLSSTVTVIIQLLQGCWELIKAVFSVVAEWFNANVITPVKTFFTNLWNAIKNAASSAWNGIKNIWAAVKGWFNSNIITPVKTAFTGMWNKLKSGASDAWAGIKSVFSKVVSFFKETFTKAWTAVKNVFSAGGKIFDGIKDGIVSAFKTIVNAIIRGINKVVSVPFNAINNVLSKIRSVSVAGISPFKNLGSISVPQIPLLAKGGIVDKATAAIFGENGAEAVVPLEKNTGWLDKIADRLAAKINIPTVNSVNNHNTTNVTNNFYQTNNSPKPLSRLDIYRQSKNLLSLKGG